MIKIHLYLLCWTMEYSIIFYLSLRPFLFHSTYICLVRNISYDIVKHTHWKTKLLTNWKWKCRKLDYFAYVLPVSDIVGVHSTALYGWTRFQVVKIMNQFLLFTSNQASNAVLCLCIPAESKKVRGFRNSYFEENYRSWNFILAWYYRNNDDWGFWEYGTPDRPGQLQWDRAQSLSPTWLLLTPPLRSSSTL